MQHELIALRQYGIVDKAMDSELEGVLFGEELSFATVDYEQEAEPP